MAIEQKQVQYAKEIDDCLVLAVELIKDIKAGKTAAQIAAENLPNFITAVAGIEGAKAEFEGAKAVVLATVGSRMGELAGVLIG